MNRESSGLYVQFAPDSHLHQRGKWPDHPRRHYWYQTNKSRTQFARIVDCDIGMFHIIKLAVDASIHCSGGITTFACNHGESIIVTADKNARVFSEINSIHSIDKTAGVLVKWQGSH